jgi:hypothetical protein
LPVGVNQKDYDMLVNLMKKYQTDILTDGYYYYTISGNDIAKITNGYDIVHQMTTYWKACKDNWQNMWMAKKTFVTKGDIKSLSNL